MEYAIPLLAPEMPVRLNLAMIEHCHWTYLTQYYAPYLLRKGRSDPVAATCGSIRHLFRPASFVCFFFVRK